MTSQIPVPLRFHGRLLRPTSTCCSTYSFIFDGCHVVLGGRRARAYGGARNHDIKSMDPAHLAHRRTSHARAPLSSWGRTYP